MARQLIPLLKSLNHQKVIFFSIESKYAFKYTYSVHFQGKPFTIIVIQVYALTSNAEEAEVEQFYEDLQDLLELTPKKKKKNVLFIIGD